MPELSIRLLALSALLAASAASHAADKLILQTTWVAQAEQGGYYQAIAAGIYKKYGLDVEVRAGGPQLNNMTLLLAKRADVIVSYDLQVLKGIEQQFPVRAIAAPFQFDPQGLLTHVDIKSLNDLKGKTVLVSASGQATWWPWLKARYHLQDSQVRPYTFNMQPFLADKNSAQQAYATSEVQQAEAAAPDSKFWLFAEQGYPAYGGILVTRSDLLAQKPEVLKRFVEASMAGWKSYLADPAPGNALIKKANPQMSDAVLAFGVAQMKKLRLIEGGDAATRGIGVMTDARWRATRDFMVGAGLLSAQTDYKAAYTTQFWPQAAM
ncbi:ABC transporter substrate-binding protein [Pluralibacter gergoviae]|uniref:ABC transporter substrate-binding protein n=1 Tax=Pluralibacter gergoviae TaxID=61647 RepID=A0AAW8HG01_PLUGE|nr:ABC transporter substrate-binding protein [Pluralibacter gergoviae]AVR04193.1 bicyclomycin resistance protein [Pluralibacter gergoviae]KMK06958.1 bicyclomycin resistance protein [Pluralibacter gergoviae]KMK27677.1 bicyclomycin resistance protein [Pluralibacter gergoviae]MDQ2307523.1 ABC transporter substrate-binding protein [Pluralibacter gergoviae]SUB71571.1 ABC-type taurine transport system, periplasmic component [Pluralibacter gergoviae]